MSSESGESISVSETIYDRKAAIRNTVVYAIALVLAIAALVTRKSALGYILVGIIVLWAIGGLTANVRAIRHGVRDLD
jgi:branched-subunit amino acid transport protein